MEKQMIKIPALFTFLRIVARLWKTQPGLPVHPLNNSSSDPSNQETNKIEIHRRHGINQKLLLRC